MEIVQIPYQIPVVSDKHGPQRLFRALQNGIQKILFVEGAYLLLPFARQHIVGRNHEHHLAVIVVGLKDVVGDGGQGNIGFPHADLVGQQHGALALGMEVRHQFCSAQLPVPVLL